MGGIEQVAGEATLEEGKVRGKIFRQSHRDQSQIYSSPHRCRKKRSTYHTQHMRSQSGEEIASEETVTSLAMGESWSRKRPRVPSHQQVVSKMLWFSRSARMLAFWRGSVGQEATENKPTLSTGVGHHLRKGGQVVFRIIAAGGPSRLCFVGNGLQAAGNGVRSGFILGFGGPWVLGEEPPVFLEWEHHF